MKNFLIILALLALWPGYVHAQINQDTINSDVPGGGGGSGGGLTESDINTPAKLNAFVTPDLADISSAQSLTNKTIDAAANTIKILKGADCTTFDAAVDGQYCWDTDDDLLYVCETADVCDTSDEWDAVASTSTPSVQSIVIADSGDGNAAVDDDTEITSTIVEVMCQDSDGCDLLLSNTNAVVGQQVTIIQDMNGEATTVTGQVAGTPVLASTCSGAGAELPAGGASGARSSVNFYFEETLWQEECITNPILGSVPLADVATSADSADDLDCTDCVALGTETSGNYVGNVATTSPLSGGSAGSEGASLTLTIANAAADGSTKGAASFTANDFDASSGNISIDYTNGQAASTSTKGFLTSTDWDTFNAKLDAADLTDENIPNDITIDNAATADALSSDPTACSEGDFVTDIDADGTLTCDTPAGGGGSAITLDLGDDGGDDSTDLNEIAITGDTNSIFTEPANDKLLIDVSNNWPTADSADDLDCTGCVGDSELASTFLKSADIDTFSELDTIVADETLVNTNDAQTLTNKTISGADNTLSNIPWASLTGVPAFRKTLVQLKPNGASLPATSFANPTARNSIPTLRYNGNVSAFWCFTLPNTYGGNGTTVEFWVVSTETSNDTDWDVAWARMEAEDLDTSNPYASAISADNNNNNATSGIPTKVSVAFTDGAQMDSCAAGEFCCVRITRDDTADTGGADTIDYVMGDIKETP